MNFNTPEWVSINEYKEQIEITVYANHFFSDISGVFIPQGFVLAKEPIVQISARDKAVVENLGSNLTKAMMFVMGSSFIISLILGATLQPLLGSIEILQVMSFMMTINVASPANVNIFFSNLFSIISVDLVSTDEFYKKHLKLDDTKPFSDNWEFLGFGSLYSLQNFGISVIAFCVWPLMMGFILFI